MMEGEGALLLSAFELEDLTTERADICPRRMSP
jgi:hypothetical protein